MSAWKHIGEPATAIRSGLEASFGKKKADVIDVRKSNGPRLGPWIQRRVNSYGHASLRIEPQWLAQRDFTARHYLHFHFLGDQVRIGSLNRELTGTEIEGKE